LTYLHDGLVSNLKICSAWILVNYILFVLSIIFIAWTSIERYFFIFHEHFITQHRVLLHYLPLGLFTIYAPLFYMGFVLLYPCQSAYISESYICGGPCYLFYMVPCLFDWCFNVVFFLLVTCIVNVILIITNIRQRQRMKRLIITAHNTQQWVIQFILKKLNSYRFCLNSVEQSNLVFNYFRSQVSA